MKPNWQISRRTMLRGVGVGMALPLFDAMLPGESGRGGRRPRLLSTAGKAAGKIPNRMAFVFIPNGVNVNEWFPKDEGSAFRIDADPSEAIHDISTFVGNETDAIPIPFNGARWSSCVVTPSATPLAASHQANEQRLCLPTPRDIVRRDIC